MSTFFERIRFANLLIEAHLKNCCKPLKYLWRSAPAILYLLTAYASANNLSNKQNDESWPLHGRDNWEQRFSPLTQITTDNVNQLDLTWEYDMGTYRGLQATPVMVNGILYVTGTWGKVHAIDARSGEGIWKFNPNVPGKWARYGCCDVVNRGVAFWQGLIFVASFD